MANQSPFNNAVTYHEKWDTMENNAALKILDQKYFDRSICSPSCPVGWAPEVLDLLNTLDREFGIARNTETIRARRVDESLWLLFFVATYNNFKYSFKVNFLSEEVKKKNVLTLRERIRRVELSVLESLTFARKVFKMRYVNPVINKILRPKLTLTQVKEKYGFLTIYFDCPGENKEYVKNLINQTVEKLMAKGAYYSAESLVEMRKARDE